MGILNLALQRTASFPFICNDVKILSDSSNIVMYDDGIILNPVWGVMKFTPYTINWQANFNFPVRIDD